MILHKLFYIQQKKLVMLNEMLVHTRMLVTGGNLIFNHGNLSFPFLFESRVVKEVSVYRSYSQEQPV